MTDRFATILRRLLSCLGVRL